MVAFRMNYSPVDVVLDEMATTHTALRAALDSVGSTQSTMLNIDSWPGDAQAQYTECQSKWNTACDDMTRVLAFARQTLGAMRDNIKLTDSMVAGLFS